MSLPALKNPESGADIDSFCQAYPARDKALGREFHDSDTGDDLATARSVRGDLDSTRRARFISDLIEEGHLALGKISELWQPLATDAKWNGDHRGEIDSRKRAIINVRKGLRRNRCAEPAGQ